MKIDSLERNIKIERQVEQQLQYMDHLYELRGIATDQTAPLIDEALSSAKTELMQLLHSQ